jgi:penicillin-binding protein 1A
MTAFAQSLNTVAAEVADEVGQAEVARLATRMGITTPLQPVPSIALGSSEVTLVDMTQAFAGFMNDGLRVSGHVVLSITDTRGETLYVRPNSAPQRVYDEALNKRMTGMMARVLQNGTGTRAQLRGRDAAGKTGTSQDWRDAWFVGFTADYTAGVWLGHDDYTPMARITGGAAPAEIWAEFMSAVSKDLPARELCCIEPIVRTPRQTTMASFYDALTSAFDLGAESDGEAREEQDGM